jgi:nucleoside 2-deoxyribosyltransferase
MSLDWGGAGLSTPRRNELMNLYVICPVAYVTEEQLEEMRAFVKFLRSLEIGVHFPPDDVDQDDETGINICEAHRYAMKNCTAVLLFYAETSGGSKFDLGMAYALDKPVLCHKHFGEEKEGKSYWHVFKELERRRNRGVEIG